MPTSRKTPNIQDGCVIHCDAGIPCHIGKRVGVGHRAIIHGAVVENDYLALQEQYRSRE